MKAATLQRDYISTSRRLLRSSFWLCLGLVLLLAEGRGAAQSPPSSITFAQITDAHIFDEGWNQSVADAFRQAADDRDGLHFAIEKINSLVASGVNIDFVVFTGDLGLQNVEFPSGSRCPAMPARPQPGLPLFSLEAALSEATSVFSRLAVQKLFIVPGNNDLIDEDIMDNARYECFVDALKGRLLALPQPLLLEKLEADSVIQINGIYLKGLNTASFKKLVNYARSCSGNPAKANAQILRQACPASQLQTLSSRASRGPLVLFTHVPDLVDPYRKTPSWEVRPEVRKAWEDEACSHDIIAVFAGHFHDSNRALYATNTGTAGLALAKCVAEKTWVAPPLAVKNQLDKSPQARGLLLATVGFGGVQQVQAYWLGSAAAPQSKAEDRFVKPGWIWPVLLGVIFITALAYLGVGAWRGFLGSYRDLTGLVVAVVFCYSAIATIWFTKSYLAITDSATLIALLVVPLLLYGIASGRLTEFSGPGGWGAKFREAARQPVDLSLQPVDLNDTELQIVQKTNYKDLLQRQRAGAIHGERPIIMSLTMGQRGQQPVLQRYNRPSFEDYLGSLTRFPKFKFIVFQDANSQFVGYLPVQTLQGIAKVEIYIGELLSNVNAGNVSDLLAMPGIISRTISPGTSNAEALETMSKLGVDSILVIDQATQKIKGIAERIEILSHMLLALSGGTKV